MGAPRGSRAAAAAPLPLPRPLLVLAGLLAAAAALGCYQCGQYNDGVGSITPCINDTYMKLIECPQQGDVACLKYISEGTMVRDCATKCIEKEDWKTRTYCCTEDGCNAATPTALASSAVLQATACALLLLLLAAARH